jgi:hypothetical protein
LGFLAEGAIELLIDHQCPQCGAPAVLEESDRLYICPFCKVKSYLLARDVIRYLLPDRAPTGQALTYVPYWRFKGMIFTCGNDGIRHRFTDVSQSAVAKPAFPPSLGLRSQALRLKFVTPSAQGHFVHPELRRREALDLFTRREEALMAPPVYLRSQIGESLSLIYTPVYQTDRIYDAVLNRPLPQRNAAPEFDQLAGGPARAHLNFIPAICPACGWDLEGQRDALVLICRNCDRVWQATGRGLEEIRIAHVPATDARQVYLPFWRIKATVQGAQLASFADLARLANLPLVLKPEWESRAFRFWSLAFKVRPATLLNLARNLTLAQPRVKLIEKLPHSDLFSVTLPSVEAAESLMVVLAAFAKPARLFYPRLANIRIVAEGALLVYIPFEVGHHEYLQPELKLALNKNQLALAGNL